MYNERSTTSIPEASGILRPLLQLESVASNGKKRKSSKGKEVATPAAKRLKSGSPQGRYWLCTLSCAHHPEEPKLANEVAWLYGQKEKGRQGGDQGYLHWQFICLLKTKARRPTLVRLFPGVHAELSYCEAANEYCRDGTGVPGTQFEHGSRPVKRNSSQDWASILSAAKDGLLDSIPPDIVIRYYGSLKRIAADNIRPVAVECSTKVFWGKTNTGKSHTAWKEAGLDAFIKNPNTKWWDGYRGQRNVIIDEFRGRIDISYLLLWTDKYPRTVEVKGTTVPLLCENIWILSNLPPDKWYPDADEETLQALMRRLKVTNFLAMKKRDT